MASGSPQMRSKTKFWFCSHISHSNTSICFSKKCWVCPRLDCMLMLGRSTASSSNNRNSSSSLLPSPLILFDHNDVCTFQDGYNTLSMGHPFRLDSQQLQWILRSQQKKETYQNASQQHPYNHSLSIIDFSTINPLVQDLILTGSCYLKDST